MNDREFDLILWGATGFVGRLAAEQLVCRLRGSELRWALGGRDEGRLKALRSELGEAAAKIPLVVGDSLDPASQEALAARTKVVCSTAGPYAKFGSNLVGACVRSGTHYCDLAGEVHWIRRMIDCHQREAEQTGARLVPACGMDSIPSDLGVFFLQRAAKKRLGVPCPRVRMRLTGMQGGYSGGTAASFLHGVEEDARDSSVSHLVEDPYSLNPEGQREGPDPPDRLVSCRVEYDRDLKAWTKPFVMAPVNSKIVRRSNALLGYPYGKEFRYEEAQAVGDGTAGMMKAGAEAAGLVGLLLGARLSPTRWVLQKTVLPGSGEGPSKERRNSGFWEIVMIGSLNGESVMQAELRGEGDPATSSTSKMLVEAALCLAQDDDQIMVGGGFWTPASAMADPLLARIRSHAGVELKLFELVEKGSARPGDR